MSSSEIEKTNVLNLSREALREYCLKRGEKGFRADQVFRRIYQKGARNWEAIPEIGEATRRNLSEGLKIDLPSCKESIVSKDGTIKWRLELPGGAVETVFIPEVNRGTLCISSQVGCALGCTFCATGLQGFNRNLTTAEIIGQVLFAAHELKQFDTPHLERKPITNIVFMGMGEPLLNLRAVIESLKILLDDFSFGFSKRRVTVSTSGIVPGILGLKEAGMDVALALSLHAPTESLRSKLMPVNNTYPLANVLSAVKAYLKDSFANPSGVTIEYVMLDQINDTPAMAEALLRCLQPIPAKINLIPWNSVNGIAFKPSPPEAVNRFAERLKNANRIVLVRKNRGDEIGAACGQLVGEVASRLRSRPKPEVMLRAL